MSTQNAIISHLFGSKRRFTRPSLLTRQSTLVLLILDIHQYLLIMVIEDIPHELACVELFVASKTRHKSWQQSQKTFCVGTIGHTMTL